MCSNREKMQKSCNEFQGFVLLCSPPLKQLSLSEIPFSFSETVLTLFGEKLAASFCRMNDFVSFTCQLCSWIATVWRNLTTVKFFLLNVLFLAMVLLSTHGPFHRCPSWHMIISQTHLLLRDVWLHYLATDSRKKQRAQPWKRYIVSTCRKQ